MGQAVIINRTGGPEVLELVDQPQPAPGPGQVSVKVHAAGVNFIDTYFRTGAYGARLPHPIGLEGAGTVVGLGEGVQELSIGQRVAWSQVPGSYATHVLAYPGQLVPLPAGVELDLAAAAMLQGMTAHYLVNGVRETGAGDVILVHAAAGGTGLLLVQMLKQHGARVLGTCSTVEKEALARAAGCDEVIRYTECDFAERVKALTDGAGVDVVYDSVGKTTFDGSLKSLRQRGLMVLFGQASGAVPPFDLQRLNSEGGLFITRPSLVHYTATREEVMLRSSAVLQGIRSGVLDVRVGARFPLAHAAEAHAALEGRRTTGKVLIGIT